MDFDKLKDLTDQEIISLFENEDIKDIPDEGILGEIKRYYLGGKKNYTISIRINEIERVILGIVYDKWVKMVKSK